MSLLKSNKTLSCLPFLVGLVIYLGVMFSNLYNFFSKQTDDPDINKELKRIHFHNMIISIILILIIYLLCKYKHENIAWGVIFAPFIITILFMMWIMWVFSC